MQKTTIGKRLFVNSGFLCLVIAVLSFFAVNQLLNLNRISKSITEDALPGVIAAAAIRGYQSQHGGQHYPVQRIDPSQDA
jgi:hypothetical protein